MGLDMKDKKKDCAEIARRYQKAGKKGRGKLLDEYTVTLGYNRDYLVHIPCHIRPATRSKGPENGLHRS
jgi:hypothetical protein